MTLAARLPVPIVVLGIVALLIYGPIPQFANYHDFADQRALLGIPNAADVLSNVGFVIVGIWALARLWPARGDPAIAAGWVGYLLFFVALVLTGVGSGFYHWAPDNARLVWDRLPIALACAGLLSAVRAETHPETDCAAWTSALVAFAVASVAWWYFTDRYGAGDLRPYLLLQTLPLLLIPLWQTSARSPLADRAALWSAIALYALAKVAELNDHAIFAASRELSGHTAKHFLAIAACAIIAARLVARTRSQGLTPLRSVRTTRLRHRGPSICFSVLALRVPNNHH